MSAMWFAVQASIIAVAYNNLLNRWPRFNGFLYVPLNVSFATAVTVAAAAELDLSRSEIGLTGDAIDVLIGLAGTLAFAVPTFAIAMSKFGHRIADRRVTGLSGSRLAYQVLLRIPLGTALTEELLFRGVLFAAWRVELSNVGAGVMSSIIFGLWHISPTINLVRANDPKAPIARIVSVVIGAVALTATAGLVLIELRLRSGGLVAPILLHAGVNSAGTVAAVVAERRAAKRPPA